jgi:membrane fusion protein, heavy metal efflux system
VVPRFAVLHLHDRDWVFVPAGDKQFKRVEVQAGKMLPGQPQETALRHQPRPAGGLQRSPT